jgi:hypothetical protein
VDESGALVPVEAGRSGAGYFGQAGWLVPKIPFELAIRGGQIFSLGNSSRAPADEIGGGINYYFAGHAFKLQLDYFHLHSSPTPWGDGENMVRLQLQLQV